MKHGVRSGCNFKQCWITSEKQDVATQTRKPSTLSVSVNTAIVNEAHGPWFVASNFPVPQAMVCTGGSSVLLGVFPTTTRRLWNFHGTMSSANVSSPGLSSVAYGQRMFANFEEFEFAR